MLQERGDTPLTVEQQLAILAEILAAAYIEEKERELPISGKPEESE